MVGWTAKTMLCLRKESSRCSWTNGRQGILISSQTIDFLLSSQTQLSKRKRDTLQRILPTSKAGVSASDWLGTIPSLLSGVEVAFAGAGTSPVVASSSLTGAALPDPFKTLAASPLSLGPPAKAFSA